MTQIPVDRTQPPSPGAIGAFDFPAVHRHTLDNGVRVLTAESRSLPLVSIRALLDGGGSREAPEQAGLAVLTADLLESGAAGKSAAEIADAFEGMGVDPEMGAGWDAAHVGITALTATLGPAWDLLADLVQAPEFPAAEVERLRNERLASIVQRRAQPGGLADEAAARVIFGPDVRFGLPLGGVPGSVEALDRARTLEFHRSRYAPGGAAIIVAGDLDPDEAIRGAEDRFGGWSAADAVAAPSPATRVAARRQVVIVDRPGAVQSEIRIGHIGVPRLVEDYFPIVVMNTILGGSFSSRLNLNLREAHGYTYGVHSGFGMRRAPGPFLIATATETEVTAAAVSEIFGEVQRFRDGGASQQEVQDASGYLAGVFPLRLQTTAGLAAHLAELEIYGLPDDYFDRYRDRVLAVSAEQVQAAAQRRIEPEHLCVVIAGDAARLRDPFEALSLGEVQVVANVEEISE